MKSPTLFATEANSMTTPLDPAVFHPDTVTPKTRSLNETMVRLLTPHGRTVSRRCELLYDRCRTPERHP
jgi:hypothetical protein